MTTRNNAFKSALGCQNPVLTAYQYKIKQQAQFIKAIKTVLPERVAEHVVYCVLSGKNLLIYVDAEEWITQVESYQTVVLAAIASGNLGRVEQLQIRLFSDPAIQKPATSAKLPSKRNIDLLRENLAAVSDESLKQALSRLSQTLDRLSK